MLVVSWWYCPKLESFALMACSVVFLVIFSHLLDIPAVMMVMGVPNWV